MLSYFTYTTF